MEPSQPLIGRETEILNYFNYKLLLEKKNFLNTPIYCFTKVLIIYPNQEESSRLHVWENLLSLVNSYHVFCRWLERESFRRPKFIRRERRKKGRKLRIKCIAINIAENSENPDTLITPRRALNWFPTNLKALGTDSLPYISHSSTLFSFTERRDIFFVS